VVVLLCAARGEASGCVEIWDVNEESQLLDHAGGYYGKLERFGAMSRMLQFQAGAGLPGLAWQNGMPQLIEDGERASVFVRGSIARQYGIEQGIALPIFRGARVAHVITLLSTASAPIARAFEVWAPLGDNLVLGQASYGAGLEAFAAATRGLALRSGEGLPGTAHASKLPVVFDHLGGSRFVRDDAARAAGLELGIAIPIIAGAEIRAVACLLS
jgi:hypothetical protein